MKKITAAVIFIFVLIAGIFFYKKNQTASSDVSNEQPAQTPGQHLYITPTPQCPFNQKNSQILEGDCSGRWTVSYDAPKKISKCSYIFEPKVTCPSDRKALGYQAACEGQVDQYVDQEFTTVEQCQKKFPDASQRKYRLVCC